MAWQYYKPITIDHTKCGTVDSANFPVPITDTDTVLRTVANGGKLQNASGYDYAWFADSGLTTPLNFERVSLNLSTGAQQLYVKTNISASVDTVIYRAYGNTGISTDQQNVANTWNSNFVYVSHFEGNSNDSTGNGFNGADTNITYGTDYGQRGQGAIFNGTSSFISLTDDAKFDTVAQAYEAWVYPNTPTNALGGIVCHEDSDLTAPYNTLFVQSTRKTAAYWYTTTDVYYANGTATLTDTAWSHLLAGYDSTNGLIGYVNGGSDGTAAANGSLGTPTGNVFIGKSIYSGRFWKGNIDEVRIYNVLPTASWVKASYNSQNSPATFYTVGDEVAVGGGSVVVPRGHLRPNKFW